MGLRGDETQHKGKSNNVPLRLIGAARMDHRIIQPPLPTLFDDGVTESKYEA